MFHISQVVQKWLVCLNVMSVRTLARSIVVTGLQLRELFDYRDNQVVSSLSNNVLRCPPPQRLSSARHSGFPNSSRLLYKRGETAEIR